MLNEFSFERALICKLQKLKGTHVMRSAFQRKTNGVVIEAEGTPDISLSLRVLLQCVRPVRMEPNDPGFSHW